MAQVQPVGAASPVLELTGPVQNDALHGYFDFYLDPDWSMTPKALHSAQPDLFQRHPARDPDFGYTESRVWLRFVVENTTDIRNWRLHLHENFKQVFFVHVVRESGAVDTVLALDRATPFGDRPVPFPEMVAPVRIDPGERVTLYLAYWSEGSSYIGMSLETQDSFTEAAARKTAKNSFFYGMMLLLILAALASLVVLRNKVFLAYAAYASSALLYVMHADGVTFQYLWPMWPGFNSMASVVTGTGIIVFGAIYARIFLKTALFHPILDTVLIAVIAVTLGLNVVLLGVDAQLLKRALVLMSLIAIICFALAGAVAARTRFREVRFYLLAWAGAAVSATMLNMRHSFGLEISQETLHDSIRAVMVFDAVMMGLAIADGYNQLRQSRQAALQATLSEAQRSLVLTQRLNALEKQFALANQLAQSRDEQLQNTVHDLRQPLHALRLSVENQLLGENTPVAETIETTFSYLERLIADQLEASTDPILPEPPAPEPDIPGTQDILRSVYEMFLPDATDKGLRFVRMPSQHDAPLPPLVLMRIISNLVSNAIKHTHTGGVVLGSRRQGDRLLIEVHDSGPGLDAATFAHVCDRHVQLDGAAEGHGLGLAIAKDLATRHGLTLELSQMRKSGTGLVLGVPLARAPAARGADQKLA
ncbi:MAG: sensor histidine kinase [Sedimentitalea sp.]